MAVIPMSYSPGTVARRFSILDGVTIQGVLYQVIWDSKTPFAAVIEAAPSVIDGDMRHKVVATLELQRRPQLEGVLVRKFWEDNDVAQIEGIVVDGIVRDVGLATFVYETVASKAGVVLLSDNEQYEGGKALWQHIARRSSELKVFILDTDTAQYYPFDGERVCYDGESIPESEIWSEHPDRSKHGVVLVAESITGKAA
ncbi:hypothetical protein [Escherichia coli]|uniref:hypothetical protein n=1 Tax=Escherichia coli TaxID=562 RepID=UPI0011E3E6F9|nr:hypothetical protein [Escherichia coli]HBP1537788.1 hypothetical protein [Escherichia coli str. K-12 substr. MG1655star]MDH7086412.1 hypothetical protein [Escherichia coli]TYD92464.1 hypothetical protein DJ503_25815 [Escherichia coli]HBN5589306.1 hypothetical protein [Escherichia coli]HCO2489790.1 hypothetical protein [Escherichia coli]